MPTTMIRDVRGFCEMQETNTVHIACLDTKKGLGSGSFIRLRIRKYGAVQVYIITVYIWHLISTR